MKFIIIIALLTTCTLVSCQSTQKLTSLNSSKIPEYLKFKLSKITLDDSFKVIPTVVSTTGEKGGTIQYRYDAAIKDNKLVGDLIKDSLNTGFNATVTRYKISFDIPDMCCDCGHNPRHCASTKKAMMDTTAKYHCMGWTTLLLSKDN